MQAKVQKHRMNRGLVARPFRVCVAVCALMTALCVNLYAQARPDILWARSGPGSILAFSPTDAFHDSRMNTRLVRVSDGMVVRRFAPEASSAAFSPDGAILALGSLDGAVRLVRVSDGVLLRTLQGHTAWVHAVAFSPDGTTTGVGQFGQHCPIVACFGWRVFAHAAWTHGFREFGRLFTGWHDIGVG
jgi:hypothetical protein